MNNNSEDVVKSVESNKVESTSNEQRQTNKPIVISRRRLLRAGVAGIPVVLTMAGVAPGQSIMGQASAASGLVYGGTGVGVHERFDGTDMVQDNLVWSNNNGFVIDKRNDELFTAPISTTTQTNSTGVGGITLTETGTEGGTKNVVVTPKANPTAITFDAFLHKSGVYYTDFIIAETGQIRQYFAGFDTSKVLDYFTFTVSEDNVDLTSSNVASAEVKDVSVTIKDSWTQTTGYEHGSDTATTDYYLVPGSAAPAFTVKLKVTATISYSETTQETVLDPETGNPAINPDTGQPLTEPKTHTYTCTNGTSSEVTLEFTVEGKSYTGN